VPECLAEEPVQFIVLTFFRKIDCSSRAKRRYYSALRCWSDSIAWPARTVGASHPFLENLRRCHYELTANLAAPDRVRAAFDELATCLW